MEYQVENLNYFQTVSDNELMLQRNKSQMVKVISVNKLGVVNVSSLTEDQKIIYLTAYTLRTLKRESINEFVELLIKISSSENCYNSIIDLQKREETYEKDVNPIQERSK